MKKRFENLLQEWPEGFIQDIDLAMILKRTDDARHALVKRALKSGQLIRLKRGLYLIKQKVEQALPNEFIFAPLIYGPSFVSLESALSYHGWIPEAVYTTTCATAKRAKQFETPIGMFSYERVPSLDFYTGVNRVVENGGVILIASPWRALADLMYTRRKKWNSLDDVQSDMRIEKETLVESNKSHLKELVKRYPSSRVRTILRKLLKEVKSEKRKKQ